MWKSNSLTGRAVWAHGERLYDAVDKLRVEDVKRLLGRLPEAERAQATAKLAHMSQALEHATKRLTAELETAEEVTFTPATICTRHMHKSTPCTPSALL